MKHVIFFLGFAIIFIISCNQPQNYNLSGKIILSEYYNNILLYNFNKSGTSSRTYTVTTSDNLVMVPSGVDNKQMVIVVNNRKPWPFIYSLIKYNFSNLQVDTIISDLNGKCDYPSLSPNQSIITFLCDYKSESKRIPIINAYPDFPPSATLCLMDFKTKTVNKIVTGLVLSKPSWALDGKLLYVSTYGGIMLKIDTSGNIIDTIGFGYCPTLSPDGNKLAYLKGRSIYVLNLADRKKLLIASRFSKYIPQQPFRISLTWSPDSKYILYQGQDLISYLTGWASQFVVIKADGKGSPKLIKNCTAYGAGAAWVP